MNVGHALRLFACAVLCAPSPAPAVEWLVDPAGSGDFTTIQAACDAASAGDTILLAPGTYTGAVWRTVQGFSGPVTKSAVAFLPADVTIAGSGAATIDGQDSRHGLVGADMGATTISGITFRDCTPSGGENWGGALLTYRSSPVIDGCRFLGCGAAAGGAVLLSGGAGAIVRFNLFQANSGSSYGGAVELLDHAGATVENNTFVWNEALSGSAVMLNGSSVDLANNIFASQFGGDCVACINGTTATAACDLYWDNSAADILDCPFAPGQDGTMHADPLFCDAGAADFHLSSASPASPTDPGNCGLRGALPVACNPSAVSPASWGRLKSAYR